MRTRGAAGARSARSDIRCRPPPKKPKSKKVTVLPPAASITAALSTASLPPLSASNANHATTLSTPPSFANGFKGEFGDSASAMSVDASAGSSGSVLKRKSPETDASHGHSHGKKKRKVELVSGRVPRSPYSVVYFVHYSGRSIRSWKLCSKNFGSKSPKVCSRPVPDSVQLNTADVHRELADEGTFPSGDEAATRTGRAQGGHPRRIRRQFLQLHAQDFSL